MARNVNFRAVVGQANSLDKEKLVSLFEACKTRCDKLGLDWNGAEPLSGTGGSDTVNMRNVITWVASVSDHPDDKRARKQLVRLTATLARRLDQTRGDAQDVGDDDDE